MNSIESDAVNTGKATFADDNDTKPSKEVVETLGIEPAKNENENHHIDDEFDDFGDFSAQPTETGQQKDGLQLDFNDFGDFGDFDSAPANYTQNDTSKEVLVESAPAIASQIPSPYMNPLPSDSFEEQFIEKILGKSKVHLT